MKTFLSLSLFFVSLATALADVPPRSPTASRYSDLYTNSAFTDPPPVEEGPEIINDLPDWVLIGLSKYVDGTKVRLMNKKDRTRVTIPSKEATEMGFSVKEIQQDRNFIKNAVVRVQKGGMSGEVRFDPQFLVLRKSAAPTAQKGGPPNRSPNQGNRGKGGSRVPTPGGNTNPPGAKAPPKPGAVPVPTPAPQTQGNNNNAPGTQSTQPKRRQRYIPRKK